MSNQHLPLVSILAHTRNSQRTLEEHLKSIRAQTYPRIELIVVDNHSTDATLQIARRFTDRVYTQGPERSAQRNFGAKKASGTYLLVPDSDMILTPNVVKECVEVCEQNPKIKAVVIPEESFGRGFWAKVKTYERSFYLGEEYAEAARFFDREVFFELGGYDENLTGPEDWDLPERIAQKYQIGRIKNFIHHDEGRVSLLKLMKRKHYYAFKVGPYLEKWQRSPFNRKTIYFLRPAFWKNIPKLLRHPFLSTTMFLMLFCEQLAGGLGFLQAKIFKARYGKNPY